MEVRSRRETTGGSRRALGSLVALLLVCAPAAIASPGDPTALGCIRDDDTGEAGCVPGEADGLDGARSVAVSPDGRSVYVASADDSAVTTFHRDPATGSLSAGGCIDDDDVGDDECASSASGLGGASAVTVSPDGRSVYVAATADHAIVRLDRDTSTGALTFAGCIDDNDTGQEVCPTRADGLAEPTGVAVSPDGESLYATSSLDSAIVGFDRDVSTGAITPGGCIDDVDSGPEVCAAVMQGLEGASDLVVAPQGNTLYAVSGGDSALAVLVREGSGALLPVGCVGDDPDGPPGCVGIQVAGLGGARSVVLSPEGDSVYLTASQDSAITHFDRVPATGAIAYGGCIDDNESGPGACTGSVDGLWGASGVAVSADGASVLVAAHRDNALVRLARDANGFLSPAICLDDVESGFDACPRSTDGLDGATGVAGSPDGQATYVASAVADALVVLGAEGPAPDPPAAEAPDRAAPETTITRKPKRRSARRVARFAFTADEASTFDCRIDRRTYKRCASPFRKRMKAGRHRFEVRATDAAGNVDPTPAQARWRVLPAD